MGEIRDSFRVFVEEPEGKDHLGDIGLDGVILLKWILKKQGRRLWTGFIWLRIGTTVINLRVP
jgi:hypothetical protein